MVKRGRKSKHQESIIHALVRGLERKDGTFKYNLTRGEICKVMNAANESSLQVPLKQLVDNGMVAFQILDRKTRRPPVEGKTRSYVTIYYFDKSTRRELMRHYFPSHGTTSHDDEAAKRRAEFLASDYADEMFKPERFYEIITRAFLKWCMMLDKSSLREIESLLIGDENQKTLREHLRRSNKHIDDEAVKNAFSLLGQLFQQIHDLKVNQRMPADSFFESLDNPEGIATAKSAFHFLFGMKEEEIQELSSIARLSPSLLSYVLRDDVGEGMPPVFLFELAKFSKKISNAPPLGRLQQDVRNEFNKFLWRLLFVKVTHDIIDYPEIMTIRLFKKTGLYTESEDIQLTLAYLVEKVARQFIPTIKSLRNRLQESHK